MFVTAAVAAYCELSVAVGGPVSLVSDFIVSIPICVSVVLPRAAVVEVRVVHRSDVLRDLLESHVYFLLIILQVLVQAVYLQVNLFNCVQYFLLLLRLAYLALWRFLLLPGKGAGGVGVNFMYF